MDYLKENYEYLKNILIEKKLKVTPQRLQILALVQTYGHISINELYDNIVGQYPYISLATIYKNVSTMIECGILNEIKINQDYTKYELSKTTHAHFICLSCKRIEDIDLDTSPILKGFDKGLIQKVNIQVYGICKACERKPSG